MVKDLCYKIKIKPLKDLLLKNKFKVDKSVTL